MTTRLHADRKGCEHSFYGREFGIASMFNHHIPANERDYAHFTRCVERWRAVMASGDPILFVLVTQSPDDFPTFSSLAAALETITARPALLFLTVDPTCPELPIAEVRLEAEVGSHVAWRMRPLSPLGPTQFGNPLDELVVRRLIHQYAINL